MESKAIDEIGDFAYDGPIADAPVPISSTRDIGKQTKLPSQATLDNVDTFIISHQAAAARGLMNLGIITQMKWHPDRALRGTAFSYTAMLPSVEVWHALSDQHHLKPQLASETPADQEAEIETPQSEDSALDLGPQPRIRMLTQDFETSVAQTRIKVVFPDGSLGLCGEHVHMHFEEEYNTLTVTGSYGVVIPVVAVKEKI